MKRFRLEPSACISIALAFLSVATAPAASVYVGLGDSITFGETDLSYVQSNGVRGYVAGFASTLAARNGGVAPLVVNLAIDGETASSFKTGVGRTPPVVGRTDAILAAQNLNYAASPTTPQATMFQNLVTSEAAAGNTIDNISITLGFNELAALATLPTSQALAMLPATLAAYQANYASVLTGIRALDPSANLYLLGYFNPFPANPTNPAAPIFAQGGPQLNAIIQGLATSFHANYVDTFTPFVGKEASLTYLSQYPAGSTSPGPAYVGVEPIGNVHPNAAGYAVIAAQVAAAPEPASVGMCCMAALGFLTYRLRSRRAFAARGLSDSVR